VTDFSESIGIDPLGSDLYFDSREYPPTRDRVDNDDYNRLCVTKWIFEHRTDAEMQRSHQEREILILNRKQQHYQFTSVRVHTSPWIDLFHPHSPELWYWLAGEQNGAQAVTTLHGQRI
jgi:hypothetical protein